MAHWHSIGLEDFPRREQFLYFQSMRNPYVGVTVSVDVTEFLAGLRERERPFFLSTLFLVGRAANAVPEFRLRIVNGGIVEYDCCDTSHTVALPDGTYCYCRLPGGLSWEEFLPLARRETERAQTRRSLRDEDGGDPLPLLFVSSVPWLSYTALTQPTPEPPDSNPRITWGRWFEQNGRTMLPLTLLVNHSLADGRHLARFYEELARRMAAFREET